NDGQITVTASADTSLKDAAGTTITLTPTNATGTALTVASIPTQVGGFSCKAGTMPIQYLPGSCR
ncbi:MAG: pilin, partial [Burkholderiales bacterium]|nr:pilin [Burkholderiales bacterium]